MFQFLFKRKSAKASPTQPTANAGNAIQAATHGKHSAKKQDAKLEAAQKAEADQRAAQQEKKQAALRAAAAVAGNEEAALAFLLQADYADARLQAAEHIHGKAALETALAAMRNTDRRVAKLMQQRLELLQFQSQMTARANECIAFAEKLIADPQLVPNQLSQLEQQWQALGKPELLATVADFPKAEFTRLREQLAQRLQAQAVWQRRLIDLLNQTKEILAQYSAAVPEQFTLVLEHLQKQAARIGDELREIENCAEIAALPRQLLPEAQAQFKILAGLVLDLEQGQAAVLACQNALAQWQQISAAAVAETAAAADSAPAAEISETAETAEATEATELAMAAELAQASKKTNLLDSAHLSKIEKEWEQLSKACPSSLLPALQVEFGAWLREQKQKLPQSAPASKAETKASGAQQHGAQAAKSAKPAKPAKSGNEDNKASQEDKQAFSAALNALEAALQDGSLHHAHEHDKQLRELKNVRPSGEQSARLGSLRAELHRLQSWARWGGNVSREELTKAVEELPAQQLGVSELAKKVGSMRERWRALDATSGPASRPLWEKFDAACTLAYAPAAEHFKKLAQERSEHAEHAQQIIADIHAFAASHLTDSPDTTDWRAIAVYCQRSEQHWHTLGTIERKERKRLDKEFAQAMHTLNKPLADQRSIEAAKREVLINAVQGMDPHGRGVLDQLRQLQERWQELAKALPLARKVEQQLWQRFHGACDQIFAQRKENAQHEQQERRQHLQAKEELCSQLEQAASAATATNADAGEQQDKAKHHQLRDLIKESRQSWRNLGAVPRNQEAAIEARFEAALQVLQSRLDALAKQAQQAQHAAVLEKLDLCLQLEAALAQGMLAEQVLAASQAKWQALPKLAHEAEKILNQRWQQALAANQDEAARQNLAAQMLAQQEQLAHEVLRMEIVCGIDSPAEFARERLQLQVQVLQNSMKSGEKQDVQGRALLLGLVANVDESLKARLWAVLRQA